MLHESKRNCILAWCNSLLTSNIQSLKEFADGSLFHEIIVSTFSTSGKESVETLRNSVIDALNAKNITVAEKYAILKRFIDDVYHIDSSSMIEYEECEAGKELELAKVAVFLLSILVQNFLSCGNEMLNTLTMLDSQTQEDIKECLSLLVDTSPCNIRRGELHRILNRPAKCKGSPRKKLSPGTRRKAVSPKAVSPKAVSPRPVKLNRRKTPADKTDHRKTPADKTTEITEQSPLKHLLESPKVLHQVFLFRKEKEIHDLRYNLNLEENKVMDLKSENENLKTQLECKSREYNKLKEEHRKLQDTLDECTNVNEPSAGTSAEIDMNQQRNLSNLKEEIRMLRKENEQLHNKNGMLEGKLSLQISTKESLSEQKKKIHDVETKFIQMEKMKESAERKVLEMEDVVKELTDKCIFYAQVRKEFNSEPVLESSKTSEDSTSSPDQTNESMIVDETESCKKSTQTVSETAKDTSQKSQAKDKEMQKLKKSYLRLLALNKIKKEKIRSLEDEKSRLLNNVNALQAQISISMNCLEPKEQLEKNQENGICNESLCKKCSTSLSTEVRLDNKKLCDVLENLGQLWAPWDKEIKPSEFKESENNVNSNLGTPNEELIQPVQLNANASGCESDFNAGKGFIFDILKVVNEMCELLGIEMSSCLPSNDNEERAQNYNFNEYLQNIKDSFIKIFNCMQSANKVDKNLPDISDKKQEMTVGYEEDSPVLNDNMNVTVDSSEEKQKLVQENTELKQNLSEFDKDYKFQLEKKHADLISLQEEYEKLDQLYKEIVPTKDCLSEKCEELSEKCEELNEKLTEALKRAKMVNILQAQKEKLQKKYIAVKALLEEKEHEQKKFKKWQEKLSVLTQNQKILRTALEKERKNGMQMFSAMEGLKSSLLSLESKNKHLEEELQSEKIANEKLISLIDPESVFHKGMDNTTLNRSFAKAVISNNNMKLQKEIYLKNENESNINASGPSRKLVSVKTVVQGKKYANESSSSGAIFNKSLHGNCFLFADDEEEFLNHSDIAEIHRKNCEESAVADHTEKRVKELHRRNTLCPPHLQSVYPVELQTATPMKTENFFGELQKPQKAKTSTKRKFDSPVLCKTPERHLLKKYKISHRGDIKKEQSTPLQKFTQSVKKSNIHHILRLKRAK